MARRNKQQAANRPNWADPALDEEDLHYDRDEWVVPSADAQGHGVKEFLRVTPQMDRDMEIIIASKKFPYKTKSDLLRHAVARHVAFLHRIEPDIPQHFFAMLRMTQELCKDDEYKSEAEDTFKQVAARIDAHINNGDMGEAIRLLSAARQSIAQLQDCPWKRRFLEIFRAKYAPYLNPGPVTVVMPPRQIAAAEE